MYRVLILTGFIAWCVAATLAALYWRIEAVSLHRRWREASEVISRQSSQIRWLRGLVRTRGMAGD